MGSRIFFPFLFLILEKREKQRKAQNQKVILELCSVISSLALQQQRFLLNQGSVTSLDIFNMDLYTSLAISLVFLPLCGFLI